MSLDPRHRRLQELFVLGAELPPEEQAAFCRRHCADDEALRAELQTLLGLDGADDPDFLAAPVTSTAAPTSTRSACCSTSC